MLFATGLCLKMQKRPPGEMNLETEVRVKLTQNPSTDPGFSKPRSGEMFKYSLTNNPWNWKMYQEVYIQRSHPESASRIGPISNPCWGGWKGVYVVYKMIGAFGRSGSGLLALLLGAFGRYVRGSWHRY